MAVSRYGYESGTNGVALDTVVADNESLFISGSGTSATVSTTQKAHGNNAVRWVKAAASGTAYTQRDIASSSCGVDIYVYLNSAPTVGESTVLWLGIGSARSISIGITTARTVTLRNGAGGGGTNIWPGTLPVLTLATWYRISLFATPGATTGTARAAVFALDSLTPITNGDTGLLTSINAGTAEFTSRRIGVSTSTTTSTADMYLDDPGLDEAATGLIPPYGVVPPVGDPVILEGYAAVDLTGYVASVGTKSYSLTGTSGIITVMPGYYLVPQADYALKSLTATITDSGLSGQPTVTTVNIGQRYLSQDGEIEILRYDGSSWV